MSGYVSLDLLTRNARRIERSTRRKRIAAHEGAVLFRQIVAASVDHQIPAQLLGHHGIAAGEPLIESKGLGIALPPVDTVQVTRGLDELVDHLSFLLAESGHAEGHRHQLEFGYLGGNVI